MLVKYFCHWCRYRHEQRINFAPIPRYMICPKCGRTLTGHRRVTYGTEWIEYRCDGEVIK